MFRISYIRWNLGKVPFNYSRSKFHPRLDFQNNCCLLTLREISGSLKCSEKQKIWVWTQEPQVEQKQKHLSSSTAFENLPAHVGIYHFQWSTHDLPTGLQTLTRGISITIIAKVKSQKWLFYQYSSSYNLSALDYSLQLCLMQTRHRGRQKILTEINNVV